MKRALLSVSDKTGIVDLARRLSAAGVTLMASGGTGNALAAAGLPVTKVSDWTGAPEILGGRVKTLHPKVHGGILARRNEDEDQADLAARGIEPIDLVVVNLYPFEAAAARGVGDSALVEEIDIGGPTLLRAAAKNHAHVTVLCDPADYDQVAAAVEGEGVGPELRSRLALKAFERTAAYDAAIVAELSARSAAIEAPAEETPGTRLPRELRILAQRSRSLRYGENPHQQAALYLPPGPARSLAGAIQHGGKALSYNNLVDADGAWRFVAEWPEEIVACVVKHAAPCGACLHEDSAVALESAFLGDPLSAFGGIVAINTEIDLACAKVVTAKGRFVEVVLATGYTAEALALLKKKKNLRILELERELPGELRARRIAGGWLLQESDRLAPEELTVVTKKQPSLALATQVPFALHCVKHVRSNAIVLVKARELIGVGGGQPSRVDAVKIATRKAGARAKGALLASDAFFPFPDGVEAAAEAGVRLVVQPGGSKRDAAVTEAADARGLAMAHTGRRHFYH